MKAESRQIPQKLAARLKFFTENVSQFQAKVVRRLQLYYCRIRKKADMFRFKQVRFRYSKNTVCWFVVCFPYKLISRKSVISFLSLAHYFIRCRKKF